MKVIKILTSSGSPANPTSQMAQLLPCTHTELRKQQLPLSDHSLWFIGIEQPKTPSPLHVYFLGFSSAPLKKKNSLIKALVFLESGGDDSDNFWLSHPFPHERFSGIQQNGFPWLPTTCLPSRWEVLVVPVFFLEATRYGSVFPMKSSWILDLKQKEYWDVPLEDRVNG